ncbi:activator of Hsp90 ATPase [Dipodascopsis tothii]|uniref:activator of Hsp90 ATPase n=1 Tax=Dipodascopsis tothii TaxID=44089 RepID=UPI0034CE3ADD
MVLHNPNNWHWVDKNCVEWSKTYLGDALVGASAEADGNSVAVSGLNSLSGDVDVSQRKGKVISLFDVKVVLDFAGKVGEEDVAGTITVPEVAYDTEEDEYVFDVAITNETREKQPVRELVRRALVPELRKRLARFGPDLIAAHGADIQHPVEQNKSAYTAGHQSGAAGGSRTAAPAAKPAAKGEPAYNTTTVKIEDVFNTTAAELYTTFMDAGRVAAWSRSPPVLEPVEGGAFALFGGNVTGTFVRLVPDKAITMAWRLGSWKPGHHAELTVEFDQGQGETRAKVCWTGVPVGQEDTARRNFEEYYIKAIKLTFGFGAVL